MEARQVYYCLSGPAHLPYLVVSLESLRRHMPDVDVVVYVWPESQKYVEQICDDPRLDVRMEPWSPAYRGKNAQFVCKIVLAMLASAECKLYLDADTIINGDLTPLFELGESHGFCATQFNSWEVGGVVRNRILRLQDREGIPQHLVDRLLQNPWPSVNGGVFSCRPESPVLPEWHRRTTSVKDIFIADETVLHTLICEQSTSPYHAGVALTTAEVCWNCSPIVKYRPNTEKVMIWHFHGDSNVRPGKSQEGYDLWWPEYERCLDLNLGNMHDWIEEVVMTNKHMRRLILNNEYAGGYRYQF